MMFAPLLGVNNHGHTTVFGCALLKNEKTESFEWLFEEMLKAMSGEPLKVIITDQDRDLAKAIDRNNNFINKGWVEGAFKDLPDCIWDIESKEDFEASPWMETSEKGRWYYNDENCAHPFQLHTLIEDQMAKLYTQFTFEKFQVEELKSWTCFLREQFGEGNEAAYNVLKRAAGVAKMKRLVFDTTSVGKDVDNYTVSKRAQPSKKASDLIDKEVMSEEGAALLSRTLKVLDTKMNCKSSQTEVLKDLIQGKRKWALKTISAKVSPKNIDRLHRAPFLVMLPGEMKLLTLSLIQCQPKAVTLNLRAVI
ncbi:protein FAR1-RELATED SEQUENCE 5-like [Pyrus ussuriensis x Pyrus communis]|uniref:Protein FAR1-RELATED SEQUENCE n=1 Tax=Pyrus ussuriensis x Pyrus communis TaxID=2448454 RepID=A0A5N5GGU8_9ROSA|nr:protein FAR1-RELATED SEQUENCE 5-like [Pyrus ussuriensis x Pyrus communis]